MLRLILKILLIMWLFFFQPEASEDEIPFDTIPHEQECQCKNPNCWQGELGPACGWSATTEI